MSDILIKGMETPKSCQECIYVLGYNVPLCPTDAIEGYLEDERKGRHPSCPLVEVQAHGDLIDRDLWLATHWVSEQVMEAIKDAPVVLEATE